MIRVALLLLASLASPSAWSDVFVGLDIGAGDLDVDNVEVAPEFELSPSSDSAAAWHVTAGYEFDNGFSLLIGYEEVDSIEFLFVGDSVDLRALKAGLGYSRPISDHFRLGGAVGIADWELEARESSLFNPGPEATGTLDDTDIFFDLGIEWVINDTFRLPFTVNFNDFDFGDATIWRFGVRIHFQ